MATHIQAAREAALYLVCADRRHLGEPACVVGSVGDPSSDGALGTQTITWINHRLAELCDLASTATFDRPIQVRDIFSPPDSLVYLSAQTESAYRCSYELIERIHGTFLHSEATGAEGSMLVISRLGRATMCYFVSTLVPLPDEDQPELLLALWPMASQLSPESPAYTIQATICMRSPRAASNAAARSGQPPLRASPPSPPQPASPSSLTSSFTCHRGWRVWHPYCPSKPS